MEFNATFIVAFFSFAAFILIMNFILYEPIGSIVSKRQKIINDNYGVSKTNSLKIEEILSEREKKLTAAKAAINLQTKKTLEEIQNQKNEKLNSANLHSKTQIEENKVQLQKEKTESVEFLKNEIVDLAQLISDRILKNHEKIENVDREFIENIIQD